MDIIQLMITIIGFIGLVVYQHYRIKGLKDQTTSQNELLQSIKTYFDIFKPEMFKQRVELFEKTIEKEKKIEINKIEEELKKEKEKSEKSIEDYKKIQEELTESLIIAFFEVEHQKRRPVFDQIKPDSIRKALEPGLLRMEKIDKKYLFPPVIPVSSLIKALENYPEKGYL